MPQSYVSSLRDLIHNVGVLTELYRTSATDLARSLVLNVSLYIVSCHAQCLLWLSVTDTVSLGSNLVIQNQSIGVASQAQGFDDVDGILGIGPVDLTTGTLSTGQPVPTVTDNLFSQGTISSDSIGISYQPTTSDGQLNGELTFGGVDTSK